MYTVCAMYMIVLSPFGSKIIVHCTINGYTGVAGFLVSHTCTCIIPVVIAYRNRCPSC